MFNSPDDIRKLLRNTVFADKWDEEDYEAIKGKMEDFKKAHRDLLDVIDTGENLLKDTFMSLLKVDVDIHPNEKIRPSYLINKAVVNEAIKLEEWEKLRQYSLADDVAAAMAATTMEPELEEISKRLKDKAKRAKEIEQQLQDLLEKMEEKMDLDDMIQDLDDVPDDLADRLEELEQQISDMDGDIEAAVEDMMDSIESEDGPSIRGALRTAMADAADQSGSVQDASQAFGLEDAAWKKMPPEKRIELAKKFNSDRIRKLAEMFGSLQRLMWAEQQKVTYMVPEEIHSVTTGNDVGHILAHELARLSHPTQRLLFFKDFMEENLSQYELKGVEKVGKGGIICCIDESGSMSGQKEMWAKAVGLCLLNLAKEQKRAFYGIHFGSPNRIQCFDFTDIRNIGLDDVFNFASQFQGGGPLHVEEKILSEKGWKSIGSAEVGDQIYGPDGNLCTIEGVYPQGELDLYTVEFDDGQSVECDSTHLWTVDTKDGVRKTLRLHEMMDLGIRYVHKNGIQYRFRIKATDPINYPEENLPLDPYLLGYMLGNGGLTSSSPTITSTPGDEIEWMKVLPPGIIANNTETRPGFCPSFQLVSGSRGTVKEDGNSLTKDLRDLGLWGQSKYNKFVPEVYLRSSIDQRFSLLQGLLDSDGDYPKPGTAVYSTVSKTLAEDVVELVESLGMIAHLSLRLTRRPNEVDGYRVHIRVPRESRCPFRLKRYKEVWVPRIKGNFRTVTSVTPSRRAPAICIKVSREDGLFLTTGYITTHNTDFKTPLNHSLDRLKKEFDQKGNVDGDIVFITDGHAYVDDAWLRNFKAEQERIGFSVWGIVIGGSRTMEPLFSICDGNVFNVKDLRGGSDIAEVLGSVGKRKSNKKENV